MAHSGSGLPGRLWRMLTGRRIRPFRGFRRLRRWQQTGILMAGALLTVSLVACAALVIWVTHDLPSIDNIGAGLAQPSTRILDRAGRVLYEVIDPQGGRNTPVPLAEIPAALLQATIATEDRYFYSHAGVDLGGMLRALWINMQGGEIRAGGSTITQQVVRTLLLDPRQRAERTLHRKLREMALALQLSARYSRDEILALYLNQVYYGSMAYGIQAAARVYFDKDVSTLTLAECAMLAGLPQSPASYSPLTDPEAAKRRQRVVLDLMVEAGYLTRDQADEAAEQPLHYGSGRFPMQAPHFVQEVWAQVERAYPDQVYSGGLEITTTLDLDWQHTAERIAVRHLEALNTATATSVAHEARGAALVAMDPATGQIRAMLGSVDYFGTLTGGAINMAVVPRQPGSTLKPFTYALALDPSRADHWTAATMILDVRTAFVTRRLESYVPVNYDLQEHGPVSMREALGSSYNIPAALALDHVGIARFVDLLHRLGISTLRDPTRIDLSIALGGGDVRLTELTAAYAAFARGGRPVTEAMILRILDREGNVLYEWQPPVPVEPVIDPRVAWLVTDMLSDNNARLRSFGINSPLRIGRPAAAKTGTTTDFRDNWTIGYTPDLVVGVWVGNPDNSPMVDITGISGAAPIWHSFMRAVLVGQPEYPFERPAGLVQAEVCAISGLLPTPNCQATSTEWFVQGTVPTDHDHVWQAFNIDVRTGELATAETPPEMVARRVYMVLPQEARNWAIQSGIEQPPVALDAIAPGIAGNLADDSNAAAGELRIIAPDAFTVYQVSPRLPPESQQLQFSAIVPPGTVAVEYVLNGQPVARAASEPWWAHWPLAPGSYVMRARATLADGSTRESEPVMFEVEAYIAPADRPLTGTMP